MIISGRVFSFVRGSDVERDGMYLEVSEQIDDQRCVVFEVFYSDENGKMTFSGLKADLPFELLEVVARTARESLTPINMAGEAI